jgi:hypothetical protein
MNGQSFNIHTEETDYPGLYLKFSFMLSINLLIVLIVFFFFFVAQPSRTEQSIKLPF